MPPPAKTAASVSTETSAAPAITVKRRRTAITAATSSAAGHTLIQVATARRIEPSHGRPTSHRLPASASGTVIAVEPVHAHRTEERDEREPEPRGGDAPVDRPRPTSIAKAAASHSVIRIAHATSYPAIQAKPWASTIGTRASCGYTHDSVTPTMARPSIAHVDHGS